LASPSQVKKQNVRVKLATVAERVLKTLPKTKETVYAFDPLEPFNVLIEEDVSLMVLAIQKDLQTVSNLSTKKAMINKCHLK
jgi:hypothetical protein